MKVIHHTACIGETSHIGENCRIGPYAVVEDNVSIGDNTTLEAHAVIKQFTTLGKNNHIHAHAVLGDVPQDISFHHAMKSSFVVGDNNTFREFFNGHRSKQEGGTTVIGSNCYFMASTHVAHDCLIGNNVIAANGCSIAGHAEVDEGVFFSASSGVHQFCKVGAFVMVGFGSSLIVDVPPYCLVHGNPAKIFRLNLVGLRRNGFSRDALRDIERVYHLYYRSGLTKEEFLERAGTASLAGENAQRFVRFIRRSKRGVMGFTRRKPDDERE